MKRTILKLAALMLTAATFITSCDDLLGLETNGSALSGAPLSGEFSVSATKKVHFSKGNLQARYNGRKYTWGFAENQYDYIGNAAGNTTIDNQSKGNVVDLFGWSTFTTNYGISTANSSSDYASGFVDWGRNIGDGRNWHTLSHNEWLYLLKTRSASTVSGASNARYAKATVNGKAGMILLPDSYTHPAGVKELANINTAGADYSRNSYSADDWTKLESAGVVFLPAVGFRSISNVYETGSEGYYWSSTARNDSRAYNMRFNYYSMYHPREDLDFSRFYGYSVRLVTEKNN